MENDHKNPFKHDRKISNRDQFCQGKVIALAMNPSEDQLIVGLNNGSLLAIPLTSERGSSEEQMAFENVIQPFHTDKITGLDTCKRKSLIATCSLDKSVRLWNYLDVQINMEICKVFEEKALALSFHPSGLMLLVSFTDKVHFYGQLKLLLPK